MGKLLQWLPNIINHFWYSCSEANGDVALLKVCNVLVMHFLFTIVSYCNSYIQTRWMSLLHHVQDDHEGTWGKCAHDLPLTEPPCDRCGEALPWFLPEETATDALRKIVLDRKWLETMKFYVNFRFVFYITALPCSSLCYFCCIFTP